MIVLYGRDPPWPPLFIETLLAQEGAATEGPPAQDYHILRYIPLVAELAKITLIQ